MNQQNRCSN